MKKRLAAVAAMSLAMFQGLSVVGMLPAQAAAPVVVADDCYVTAGTLFALGSNSDIIEGLTGTLDENGSSGHADGLDVDADTAALIDQGDLITVTAITGGTGVEIAVTDVLEVSSETGNTQLDFVETGNNIDITGTATVTFELESLRPGDVTLSYTDGDVICDVDGASETITAAFTDVVVSAEGSFTMLLNDGADAAEWPELDSVRVSVAGDVVLDASGVTDDRDDVAVELADDAFSAGGVDGEIRYATGLHFHGGDGDDSLDAEDATLDVTADGGAGDDTLKAGEGDDDLTGNAGADKLFGNDGDDSLDCSAAESTAKIADQCWGGDGDDTIDADASAADNAGDTVAPGDGEDTIDNAAALYYGDSSEAIEVDLLDGPDVMSDAGDDDVTGTIDAYIGSGEDDTLSGDGDANAFIGGGGDDTLVGLDGADYLAGGGGDDTVFAGGGADQVFGNGGDDTIYGGADADYIKGGAGDDVMYGVDGPDQLRGGKGADQAWGGRGSDTCLAEVRDHCELGKIN